MGQNYLYDFLLMGDGFPAGLALVVITVPIMAALLRAVDFLLTLIFKRGD